MESVTKGDIFDLFYAKQDVVRSGGGKVKSKMTRQSPSLKQVNALESKIKDNKKLMKYFVKLRYRKSDIAPPPRPT